MADFNKEELLKIAQLSALKLEENEVKLFSNQIASILSYVDQLQEVTITTDVQPIRNTNIFRDDVAQKGNADAVLAQAPQTEERYFIVPKILE